MVTTQEPLRYGIGEFDIAVTIHRPERRGLKVTRLCDYDFGLYASAQYLATHPPISARNDLAAHDLLWYVESLLELPVELPGTEDAAVTNANIVFRTTNLFSLLEAAAAGGVGLALLPCFLAHHDNRLLNLFCAMISGRGAAVG